ncbi:unnamed protein product [Cercospora beticola]|nr:unnamed protein product [Cercospora beticola]
MASEERRIIWHDFSAGEQIQVEGMTLTGNPWVGTAAARRPRGTDQTPRAGGTKGRYGVVSSDSVSGRQRDKWCAGGGGDVGGPAHEGSEIRDSALSLALRRVRRSCQRIRLSVHSLRGIELLHTERTSPARGDVSCNGNRRALRRAWERVSLQRCHVSGIADWPTSSCTLPARRELVCVPAFRPPERPPSLSLPAAVFVRGIDTASRALVVLFVFLRCPLLPGANAKRCQSRRNTSPRPPRYVPRRKARTEPGSSAKFDEETVLQTVGRARILPACPLRHRSAFPSNTTRPTPEQSKKQSEVRAACARRIETTPASSKKTPYTGDVSPQCLPTWATLISRTTHPHWLVLLPFLSE